MYSLYRAWLSLGPCPIPTLPPPGPLSLTAVQHPPGAPDVALQVGPNLTQFSAHRTVLSAHSGFFKAALLNRASEPISVPNVNVDEFSSLLTFMYTGYLDLNLGNIYSILLATHILHMPRALEICRNFLLQSQSHPSLTQPLRPSIVKPIPSRKAVLPTPQIFAPTFSQHLHKSDTTPFKTVSAAAVGAVPAALSGNSALLQLEKATTSTSKCEETTVMPDSGRVKSERPTKITRKRDEVGEKVIVDIACCDGPVRFHRVINRNYGSGVQCENQIGDNTFDAKGIEVNKNMNKAMSENIRDQQLLDENQHTPSQNNSELFTCLYCNHTFKSQYCYQKHARRHLNPVSLEAAKPHKENPKREVKLLDMNVQYYPCKTCGSKFPSYYFVHKHRKMCHADEMADNTNKNNEMVPEGEESANSPIDVEAESQ